VESGRRLRSPCRTASANLISAAVARQAMAKIAQADGQAVLELAGGTQVQVNRTY
jgi:hypothetical protein